jgi:C1A family cysteine protease
MASYNAKYGWRPDKPDHRDHRFAKLMAPAALPSFWDLRPQYPAPFNQLALGSCTGNAIASIVETDLIRQKKLFPAGTYMPSRLFIYYNERVMEGTVNSDAGAEIRDGIKSIATLGVCSEKTWPYDVSKFTTKPPKTAFSEALKFKSVAYQRVNQDLLSMKSCIAGGNGFALGFSVYDSFESDAVASTGIVPMPSATENLLGGHAVVAVGYNDTTVTVNDVPPQTMICRNSWGPYWGAKGYFFMPFAYLLNDNLASDFWNISVMA